jgi:hypothetical protein
VLLRDPGTSNDVVLFTAMSRLKRGRGRTINNGLRRISLSNVHHSVSSHIHLIHMSASHKTYPYDELPQGDVFRYLVLEPGVDDEPLVCNLQTAQITDTHFEAVSYVWGTSVKDQPIVCEDHVMNITPSLAKVLRRIRLLNKPVKIWADSVCINQEDLKEKGNQVALMGKIYRSANRVLIHIGSDDGGQGPALCSLLDEVNTMIQTTCKAIDMSWNSFPYTDKADPLLVDPRWNALYMLLKQDWFDRGWVVQEAASTPDGELLWGQSRISWDKLMRVYVWLSTRGADIYYSGAFSDVPISAHLHIYLESHDEFGRAFYDDLAWGSPSILRTLNSAKELDLSNPCDRIYAFMDLPRTSEEQVVVHPDYLSTHLQAYHQFAIRYIERTSGTKLLDYVSHDEKSLSDDIPSWVPRWDIPTWSVSLNSPATYVATSRKGSVIEPVIIDGTYLSVRGVIIDALHFASDTLDWDTITVQTLARIWQRISTLSVDCPYVASSKPCQFDAFLDAISAGTYRGEDSAWQHAKATFGRELRSSCEHLHDTQSSEDAVGGAENQPSDDTVGSAENKSSVFFEHVKARTHNRKIILTNRGYMGLAPAVVEELDLCAIVFGCKTPCVLRPRGQHYMYLGATSIMGKEYYILEGGPISFCTILGDDESRDWVEWDIEEQDIDLC